jgi:hypothetical protein
MIMKFACTMSDLCVGDGVDTGVNNCVYVYMKDSVFQIRRVVVVINVMMIARKTMCAMAYHNIGC